MLDRVESLELQVRHLTRRLEQRPQLYSDQLVTQQVMSAKEKMVAAQRQRDLLANRCRCLESHTAILAKRLNEALGYVDQAPTEIRERDIRRAGHRAQGRDARSGAA